MIAAVPGDQQPVGPPLIAVPDGTPEPAEFSVKSDESTVATLLAEVGHLRIALENRDVIGQAKGVIRVVLRCDSQQAFDVLRALSTNTHHKLRDVAVLVVEYAAGGAPLPADVAAAWKHNVAVRQISTGGPDQATAV